MAPSECVWAGKTNTKSGELDACTYTAKVRVQVYPKDSGIPVIREGCGAGHGMGRNPGDAHESALKEAETNAMKRALMTFGNQFGLALYDKTQKNVTDDKEAATGLAKTALQAKMKEFAGELEELLPPVVLFSQGVVCFQAGVHAGVDTVVID